MEEEEARDKATEREYLKSFKWIGAAGNTECKEETSMVHWIKFMTTKTMDNMETWKHTE